MSATVTAGELKHIPLKQIRENPVALRSVNRSTEKYIGLVDSVKQKGILNPINVREVSGENGESIYGLVDGLHRYTAAGDAGLETIPAIVQNRSDADVLEAQIVANMHKIETKAFQYSKQLVRLLAQRPTMTKAELCKNLSKSGTWLDARLGLEDLAEEIGALVDEEKLPLSNAYALSKLPKEEQPNFLERAMTQQPAEFLPAVQNRIKEIRDAKRQGKTPGEAGFHASPRLRKMSELKDEMDSATIGPVLVKENGIKTADEGFALGIKWVLNMDPTSVLVQEAKDKERKAEETRKNEVKKKETLEKKAKEAAGKVAQMTGASA